MSGIELAPIFQSVLDVMLQNQQAFNQADPQNMNHGDHMVRVFELAVQAGEAQRGQALPDAMDSASELLAQEIDNGSAQVYARGLSQFAAQFRRFGVSLDELVAYVKKVMDKAKEQTDTQDTDEEKSEILKSLLSGLASWKSIERGETPPDKPLDMGYMFDLGIAYMQAKTHGGNRLDVFAEAAASVSPLSNIPHRYESGKLAIRTLLAAMQSLADDA